MLRRGPAREQLLARLDGVDRLVLLGDVLELRHGPAREALAVARPVLADIAAALAPGTPVVIVPGNHDHALIDPWLLARGRRAAPEPLGLAERVSPRKASPLAAAIERAMAPASVELSYPGVWLRDDVWATHGHYLDVHATLPTFERLARRRHVAARGAGPGAARPRRTTTSGSSRRSTPGSMPPPSVPPLGRAAAAPERRAGVPAAQRRRPAPDGRPCRRRPVPARDPRRQPRLASAR